MTCFFQIVVLTISFPISVGAEIDKWHSLMRCSKLFLFLVINKLLVPIKSCMTALSYHLFLCELHSVSLKDKLDHQLSKSVHNDFQFKLTSNKKSSYFHIIPTCGQIGIYTVHECPNVLKIARKWFSKCVP